MEPIVELSTFTLTPLGCGTTLLEWTDKWWPLRAS